MTPPKSAITARSGTRDDIGSIVTAYPPGMPNSAHGLAYAIAIGSAVVWLGFETVLRIRDIGAGVRAFPRSDRMSGPLLSVLLVGGIVLALLVARQVPALALPGPSDLWAVAGAAVTLTGLGIRVWAVRTLGRFFRLVVMIQEDHRVVSNGPYRWVRHPSYSGLCLIILGVGISMGNFGSVLLCGLTTPIGLLPRIRTEEAALHERLGEDYANYAQRTARLVPHVW